MTRQAPLRLSCRYEVYPPRQIARECVIMPCQIAARPRSSHCLIEAIVCPASVGRRRNLPSRHRDVSSVSHALTASEQSLRDVGRLGSQVERYANRLLHSLGRLFRRDRGLPSNDNGQLELAWDGMNDQGGWLRGLVTSGGAPKTGVALAARPCYPAAKRDDLKKGLLNRCNCHTCRL
jgi:hypothetical protein